MRTYEVRETIGPEGVVLNPDRPAPEPGHGEILVRVRATSLNYRDLMIAKGAYRRGAKPNVIPLSDGAGDIVTVGPGVTRFKAGDQVCGAFFPDWAAGAVTVEAVARALGGSVDGMLAEYVALPETGAIAAPNHMTLDEAATLPCAALTAWNAVSEIAKVRPGQTVLLLGTGGVSLFALQFTKLHGARAILASSSNDKMALAKTLGADEVLNYRETPEWDKRALELTDGRGVDLVVEVGGANTLERSIRSTRIGGVVAMIGFVAGGGRMDPSLLVSRVVRLQGVYVGSLEMFAAMNAAIAQTKLRPVVDRVFPFEEAQQAYRHLESGAHFGKVVVSV